MELSEFSCPQRGKSEAAWQCRSPGWKSGPHRPLRAGDAATTRFCTEVKSVVVWMFLWKKMIDAKIKWLKGPSWHSYESISMCLFKAALSKLVVGTHVNVSPDSPLPFDAMRRTQPGNTTRCANSSSPLETALNLGTVVWCCVWFCWVTYILPKNICIYILYIYIHIYIY